MKIKETDIKEINIKQTEIEKNTEADTKEIEMKERIIEAVIKEFNEKCLKFTMDDIAKELGISKRTLYGFVKDKESLFLEAVDEVYLAIKESEREIAANQTWNTLEKLKRILIVLPQKYQTLDYRQLYELKTKFPLVYKKVETRIETDWEATFALLEDAIKEGSIRNISFPVFQAMVSGTIEYYLSHTILLDHDIPYETALEEMLDMLFDGILVK